MLNDYSLIKVINPSHKVYLVKNVFDNKLYIKKIMEVYDEKVFNHLSKINVEGIPNIKEIEKENDQLIIFEEYIDGETLEDLLEQGYKFSKQEIIKIGISLCDILDSLNSLVPIVHRDIKPSNIIKRNNEYYLIDFNAAKIIKEETRDTILLGTEGYAAPEQYGFASSSVQTDIYAIGILIKELSDNKMDKSLLSVVDICVKLDPESRYQTFKALKKALVQSSKNKYYYVPVGYRSRNIWHMLIASFYYLISIFMFFTLTTVSGEDIWLSRIMVGTILFSIPAFSFDYLGIQEKIGLHKCRTIIKILLIILCDFIIATAIVLFFVIIENLFS